MKKMLTSLLVLLCIRAGAQEHPADPGRFDELSLMWGLQYTARQDQVFSPLIHHGASPLSLGLAYQRRRGLHTHRLDLNLGIVESARFPSFSFEDDEEDRRTFPHQFVTAELDYGLTWRPGAGGFHIGGVLKNIVQSLTYQYGRTSQFGYLGAFSAGARLGVERPLGRRGQLTAELDLPLLGWVARSPYLVNDDEFIENIASHQGLRTFLNLVADGALATPATLQQADLSLRYRWALSDRWSLQAGYRLAFLRHTEPLELRYLRQRLDIGAGLRF